MSNDNSEKRRKKFLRDTREQSKCPLTLLTTKYNHFYFVEQLGLDLEIDPEHIRKVTGWLRSKSLNQLKTYVDEWSNPQMHCDHNSYFRYAQFCAAISKIKFASTDEQRRVASWEKFLEGERRCRETNEMLEGRLNNNRHIRAIALKARSKVYQILGENPDPRSVVSRCKFGKGAMIGTALRNGTILEKYAQVDKTVTPNALPYVSLLCELDNERLPDMGSYTLTAANKIGYVPKNAWTFRTIAVEPGWNMYIQLGVGNYIAYLLTEVGVDTKNQQANQVGAQYASISGAYATVDLSAASDSISVAAVVYLLSYCLGWLDVLWDLRSPRYIHPDTGELVVYEKWSSMGNGYTFPLECLLFYALSVSVCEYIGIEPDVLVYGDDIIIPVEAYSVLTKVLDTFGFTVNTKKTFAEGPFRESCGEDFWDGHRVRPIFFDDDLADPMDVVGRINALQEHDLFCPRAMRYLYSLLREKDRIWGPRTEETRSHLFADYSYLYHNGHLKYDRDLQCLVYVTKKLVAIEKFDGHGEYLGEDPLPDAVAERFRYVARFLSQRNLQGDVVELVYSSCEEPTIVAKLRETALKILKDEPREHLLRIQNGGRTSSGAVDKIITVPVTGYAVRDNYRIQKSKGIYRNSIPGSKSLPRFLS